MITVLHIFFQVRTRGSIKRRPPSRRFRRSQSDCGDILDYRAVEPSQENGAGVENGDDVFSNKSKAPRSRPPNQEAMGDRVEGTPESTEKPPQRSIYNSMEKPEEQVATPGETSAGEEAGQNPDTASQGSLEAPELPHTCSTEAENGCGSPAEGTATEEHTDTGKATDGTASEESVADEEEGEIREKPPQGSSGRVEGTIIPEVETKQKEGPPVEPGCSPGVDNTSGETSNEVQNDHEACMVGGPNDSYCIMAGAAPICHMTCFPQSGVKSAQYAETKSPGPSPCADCKETVCCGARREVCLVFWPASG